MRIQDAKTGEIIDCPPGTAYERLAAGTHTVLNPQPRSERVGAGPAKAKKKKAAAKKTAKKAPAKEG